MNVNFSVLHATYMRPEKAIRAMRMFIDRADKAYQMEYIFAVNADDPTLPEFNLLYDAALKELMTVKTGVPAVIQVVKGDYHGSAPAWNEAARASTGKILIQGQDDVEPPEWWDLELLKRTNRLGFLPAQFIAVSDGYRKDALCCTAIMNREYMEMEGCFLFPGYISVFSDDDATYRALRNARDGKSDFIEAKELVFLHRHHYHDKSVEWDQTYARENDAIAYRVGEKLFRERNPRAQTDGLKTW